MLRLIANGAMGCLLALVVLSAAFLPQLAAAGDAISARVNPLPLAAEAASSGVSYSGNRDEIKALTTGALDPYVVERDAYEQNRRLQANNGVMPLMDLPIVDVDDKDRRKIW